MTTERTELLDAIHLTITSSPDLQELIEKMCAFVSAADQDCFRRCLTHVLSFAMAEGMTMGARDLARHIEL